MNLDYNPIICALDTKNIESANSIADQIKSDCGLLKLGLEFFCSNGPDAVKAIQVDCKSVITAALDRAGCTYSVLDADQDSYLCVFTTPNADTSER